MQKNYVPNKRHRIRRSILPALGDFDFSEVGEFLEDFAIGIHHRQLGLDTAL